MADHYYAPPTGPPPPAVPPGWKAQYNEQYQEWFYVNLRTQQSQWDRPTSPARGPSDEGSAPAHPPPGYSGADGPGLANVSSDAKKPFDPSSNNPYRATVPTIEDDAAMAARLQAEEDAKARMAGHPVPAAAGEGGGGHSPRPDMQNRGAGSDYYDRGQTTLPQGQGYGQGPNPAGIQGGYPGAPGQQHGGGEDNRGTKAGGGLLGKLAGKLAAKAGSIQGGGHRQHHGGGGGGYGGYSQQQQQQQQYPQQQYQQQYQQGYGGNYGHQPGYGGGMMGGIMGGGHHGAPPRRGMGAGGAAALGVGGGLVGGMLLADAIDDHDQSEYNEGFQDGQQDDYGGGDDMGDMGDMGGDF